jgi:hypothetical protein
MHPRRRWKNTPEARGEFPQGAGWPAGGAGQPHMSASHPLLRSRAFWCFLWSSSVYFVVIKFCPFSRIDPPSYVFWNNSTENRDSPRLMKFVSLNPSPMYIL